MQDYITKALAGDGSIRVFAAVTTNTVEQARQYHEMNPTPCAALGRLLTGAALMSQNLKGEKDTITIQIKGDGPLGGIVVVSDWKANVRGYVHNPSFDLPLNGLGKFDISGAVGKGYLNVIRDIGLKEPYIGFVDLVSGEIAEDLAYYYAYSEQTPTAVNLGVLIGPEGKVIAAGGFLIQLLPEAPEKWGVELETKIKSLPPMTTLIHEGYKPEDMIAAIFGEGGYQLLGNVDVTYRCNCSRERMERNLISIGVHDLAELAEDPNGAELQCHFCNKKYQFTQESLEKLLSHTK